MSEWRKELNSLKKTAPILVLRKGMKNIFKRLVLRQVFYRIVGGHFPAIENDNPIANGFRLLHDVGGEQYRFVRADVLNHFSDFNNLIGVKPRRGFVQNERFGIVQQSLRQP